VRKEPPVIQATRLDAIFDTVLGLLRFDARRAGVDLRIECPDEALWAEVQQIQIEQVLINLARNAIEAMTDAKDPRRLALAARLLDGKRIELAVSDTGPGLAPDVRERLFEPFVTTKPQGLGLGLSISAGIVEAHGGALEARPVAGAGVSFRFELPRIDRHE
jgi:C4-dicarboxylate-specific signal transduction histidine kinase